jgi:hypothetical protein
VKVATLGDSSLPAMRFRQFPGRRPADLSPGRPPLLRVGDRDPPVLRVASSDATIFAAESSLAGNLRLPLLGFSKDRPSAGSLSKSPLPRTSSLTPASGRTVPPFRPRSVSVVLRHLDGFRLFNPARLLHRAADHGVRGVSRSLRSPLPTTRSRPSKSSPLSRQLPPRSRAWAAGLASPDRCRAVHRRPSLLVLHRPPRPHRCGCTGWHRWTSRASSGKGFVVTASVSGRRALDTPLGLPFSLVTACAVRL